MRSTRNGSGSQPDLEQGLDGEEATEEEATAIRKLKLAANKGPDQGGIGQRVQGGGQASRDSEESHDSEDEYDEDILYKEGEPPPSSRRRSKSWCSAEARRAGPGYARADGAPPPLPKAPTPTQQP